MPAPSTIASVRAMKIPLLAGEAIRAGRQLYKISARKSPARAQNHHTSVNRAETIKETVGSRSRRRRQGLPGCGGGEPLGLHLDQALQRIDRQGAGCG